MTKHYSDLIPTPIGDLELIVDEQERVLSLNFVENPSEAHQHDRAKTKHARQQIEAYFRGERQHFDLELAAAGTDFQQRVWRELVNIPFGETRSYSQLANALDNPKAVRAVGGANGRNPIAVIVPCHRVIGANGHLTGYAGGVERKEWLLRHEGILL